MVENNDINLSLSVVVCSYDMGRELPRTLVSLSPWFQKTDPSQYEVLVIQNGGEAIEPSVIELIAPNFRCVNPSKILKSPAFAINEIVRTEVRSSVVMIIIDGARIQSQFSIRTTLEAVDLFGQDQKVFFSPAYHLGWNKQVISQTQGYNRDIEDSALKQVNWIACPERLFDVSVRAGSHRGLFELPAEANTFVVSTKIWRHLGGFDERFELPGGGLCNQELFERFCKHAAMIVCMIGEGSFHQIHGGVSSNSVDRVKQRYLEKDELVRLELQLCDSEDIKRRKSKLVFFLGSGSEAIPQLLSNAQGSLERSVGTRWNLLTQDNRIPLKYRIMWALRSVTNSSRLRMARRIVAVTLNRLGLEDVRRKLVDYGF